MQGVIMPVAVIVGCGSKYDKDGNDTELPLTSKWGLGGALSLRFAAAGFHVVLMGRRSEVGETVAAAVRAEGGTATPVTCDVTNDASVSAAFEQAKALGDIEVLVFNCAPGWPEGRTFANLPLPHEVDPEYLQSSFNVGVTGCVRCVNQVIHQMLERGRGSILLSGATMALRGGAGFACMAPVKTALRSLGQSMYQQYAPQGVHVAHIVIDGVIESPNTKPWGEKVMLQNPADIADAYVQLHEQKPTVWSYEIQLSPCKGSVGMRM